MVEYRAGLFCMICTSTHHCFTQHIQYGMVPYQKYHTVPVPTKNTHAHTIRYCRYHHQPVSAVTKYLLSRTINLVSPTNSNSQLWHPFSPAAQAPDPRSLSPPPPSSFIPIFQAASLVAAIAVVRYDTLLLLSR